MIRYTLPAALALVLAGCGSDQPESQQAQESAPASTAPAQAAPVPTASAPDVEALTADAKQAVMALGSTLKSQLQSAMKEGGPANAVDVCHKIAPAVAASLSEEHGVQLTRVSLKNRNPEMGVPNAWQTEVLQDFEARQKAGEAPDTLAYSAVVGDEYRFMKAIPTQAVCLNCHGTDIQPEVQAKITEWYPEDRAVGYSEGDIRGAFVVVRSLAAD
jgi:hypothetical protein